MAFDIKYSNKIVSPKGSGLNVRSGPGTNYRVILYVKNKEVTKGVPSAGRTTGDYEKKSDGIWYKMLTTTNKVGWVRGDVIKFYTPKTTSKTYENSAQNVVDKLIESDLRVYSNLENAAVLIDQAKKKGKNVSKIEQTYSRLLNRLDKRQKKLKDSKLLKIKEKVLKGLDWVKNIFKHYVFQRHGVYIANIQEDNDNFIGALGSMIVGGVIVGGLLATAYFVFRADYDESSEDLKISRELASLLESAEPEVAQKIREDLEKQIDKAGRSQYTRGRFKGGFNIIKTLGLAAVGLWLGQKLLVKKR